MRLAKATEMMDDLRLKAKVMVQALLRQCGVDLLSAYVIRRGDEGAGAVLIKRVSSRSSCVVFQTVYGDSGRRQWIQATGDVPVMEADADAFIERQVRYDEDVWVVEVEASESWVPPLP